MPRATASASGASLGGPPSRNAPSSSGTSSGSSARASVSPSRRRPARSKRGSEPELRPKLSARFGFGSQSTASVLNPREDSSRTSAAARVVLPTPPFPATATFSVAPAAFRAIASS